MLRVFIDRGGVVHRVAYIETTIFLIAGRVMGAVLQWMGRLYVLTDQRIIRLAGVFISDLYDCPLRKVSRIEGDGVDKGAARAALARSRFTQRKPKMSVRQASGRPSPDLSKCMSRLSRRCVAHIAVDPQLHFVLATPWPCRFSGNDRPQQRRASVYPNSDRTLLVLQNLSERIPRLD